MAVPITGCHKHGGSAAADPAPVKKSFDDLNGRLKALEAQFGDLRKKIDTIPADLPHYRETRETFFATEEGRGVMDAKMTLLSTRLDAATASRKAEELQDLSKEIATTGNSVAQIEQLYVTLLHQVMALQRMAEKQQEAKDAAEKAAAQEAAKAPPGQHKAKPAKAAQP